jgi:hypothetical protein
MLPGTFTLAVFLGCTLLSLSASATTLYIWRNADGSFVFTDDPKGAPPNVQVRVWPERNVSPAQPTPEPAPDAIVAVPPSEESPDVATQGEFVVRLVEELGLEDRANPDQAKDILTKVRIAPRLGRWDLDQPMTSELTLRLRSLTVAAAAEGWMTLTPEEGLLAFDTTAALLGVTIPETGELDHSSGEASSAIDDVPPFVYVAPPPPEVYPYYLWQPVANGYWWNGLLVSGVYILDLDRYARHHDRHRHAYWRHPDGNAGMTPQRIEHHLRRHMMPKEPRFRDSPRPHRDPGAPGYRSPGPGKRPSVSPTSTTVNHNRTVRGAALSRSRNGVPTVGLPHANRPGVPSANTRVFASPQAAPSRDGRSGPSDGRKPVGGGGTGHGQIRGWAFSSR